MTMTDKLIELNKQLENNPEMRKKFEEDFAKFNEQRNKDINALKAVFKGKKFEEVRDIVLAYLVEHKGANVFKDLIGFEPDAYTNKLELIIFDFYDVDDYDMVDYSLILTEDGVSEEDYQTLTTVSIAVPLILDGEKFVIKFHEFPNETIVGFEPATESDLRLFKKFYEFKDFARGCMK